jgi:hypothetical protein
MHLRGLVTRFQTHVRSPRDVDAFVAQLHTLLAAVEDGLARSKTVHREQWVSMSLEERDLAHDTDALLAAAERWTEEDAAALANPVAAAAAAAHSGGAAPASSSHLPDLDDFAAEFAALDPFDNGDSTSSSRGVDSDATRMREIRSALAKLDEAEAADGGANGGWDSRDHAHFLKVYTQMCGAPAAAGAAAVDGAMVPPSAAAAAAVAAPHTAQLVARLVAEIPTLTTSTALLHIEWWARHQSRVAHKKALIARWRQYKQRQGDTERAKRELEREMEQEKVEKKAMSVG